ncbi:MAG: imidazole glycerol phosphate synthase subunit HisH [Armatimonadetes bacterium]|nr:imidazole glycerol phosphate synthase subunit HisH [Armatimonadota bacterium]
MSIKVHYIPTGVANLASLRTGFWQLEAELTPAETADEVRNADYLLLPGVGAFTAAINALTELNIKESLTERIQSDRPTFAVCLGMQLLAQSSEEAPGLPGLGIVEAKVEWLGRNAAVVPHMGWNRVVGSGAAEYAYFANSFAIRADQITGWNVASFEYGDQYIAMMQRGVTVACQFHPEISGNYGKSIMRNWLEGKSC